jgi:hypothetical protein
MKPREPNPYRDMDLPEGEDHPLDVVVRAQIPHALDDNIRIATKKLMQALGKDRQFWIDLEALLNEHRLQREEILYNIGFEHGSIAGTTKTLSRLRQEPPDTEYHLLAGELRKKIVLSRIPLHMRIIALLETAWSLSFELGKAG